MHATGLPDLNSLLVFAAVAEAEGFTAAAERLGTAKSKVSLQVSRLERQLGAALFARTTRRVTLTDAGRALYAECMPPLRVVQEALASARSGSAEFTGTLRVTAPVDQAVLNVAPALTQFAQAHPRLRVELRASDHVVDLVREGIDVGIRMGWLRDSSLRATKISEFEQFVVASPGYLARAPALERPQDLAAHEWVALSLLPTPLTWTFTPRRGRAQTVRVSSRVRADSGAALRALLTHGAGVSVLAALDANQDLHDGRLVRVLDRWNLPRGGVYAVYPPSLHVPARARAFVAFYRDFLARGVDTLSPRAGRGQG